MTLDAEVRALERTARARPDDGAAQVELASALVRMGRDGEALEAFIRAAGAEPSDPEVVRALADTAWWSGPRGPGGGSRFVPVAGLRRRPALVAAKRLGQGGAGLALGRGIVFARVTEEGGDARLVALALANGRELWSREETVAASAPPLASGDAVLDAALLEEGGSIVFRVRARDAATGADRWVRTSELTDAQPGATFSSVCVSGTRVAFAISPHGKLDFEPLVRVLDAESGVSLDDFSLRGLSDLALEGGDLFAATIKEPLRVHCRPADGPSSDEFRGQRTQRVVALDRDERVVATDLQFWVRQRGAAPYEKGYRIGSHEALVVTPRLIVGSWQRHSTIAFDLRSGDRRWTGEPMARMLSAAEDTLYSVSSEGLRIRALDLDSGDVLWSQDLGELAPELRGAGVHKLAVAPSRLVGLTKEGFIFLLA